MVFLLVVLFPWGTGFSGDHSPLRSLMHFSHWRRMQNLMGVPQAEQYFWFFLIFIMSLRELVVIGPIELHCPDPATKVL